MQVCAQSYPRRQAVPSASIERGGGSKLSHAPGYGIYIRSRQIAPIAKFGNHKATTEILVDRGSKLTLKGGRSREGCEFVRQNCGGYRQTNCAAFCLNLALMKPARNAGTTLSAKR